MAKLLDDQIIAALTGSATAAALASLITAAEAEHQDMRAKADAETEASLAPATTSAAASKHRAAASELTFQADRLNRSLIELRTRHAEAKASEAEAGQQAELDAAIAERDSLVDEIEQRYPRMVAELVDLIKRIGANDQRLASLKTTSPIPGAETFARGIGRASSNLRLTDGVRLPAPKDSAWCAWPPSPIPNAAAEIEAMYADVLPARIMLHG